MSSPKQKIQLLYLHISRVDMNRIRGTAITFFPEYKGHCDEELLAVIFAQVYNHDQRKMIMNFQRGYPEEDYSSFWNERLLYLELVAASQEKIRSTNRRGFKKSNGNFGIES